MCQSRRARTGGWRSVSGGIGMWCVSLLAVTRRGVDAEVRWDQPAEVQVSVPSVTDHVIAPGFMAVTCSLL